MPATYILISSTTLTTNTSLVNFTSIPSTYTDLVIHLSGRTNRAAVFDYINLRVNGNATSIYESTEMYYQSTSPSLTGVTQTAGATAYPEFVNGANSDSNCFAYMELYFHLYKNTSFPKGINMAAATANTGARFMDIWGGFANTTTAISSISLQGGTADWLAGSTFYLYGIVNS